MAAVAAAYRVQLVERSWPRLGLALRDGWALCLLVHHYAPELVRARPSPSPSPSPSRNLSPSPNPSPNPNPNQLSARQLSFHELDPATAARAEPATAARAEPASAACDGGGEALLGAEGGQASGPASRLHLFTAAVTELGCNPAP